MPPEIAKLSREMLHDPQFRVRFEREAKAAAARGRSIAEGVALAKDLGNLPGNICTPAYLADQARDENQLVDALKQRDAERARALCRRHLLHVRPGKKPLLVRVKPEDYWYEQVPIGSPFWLNEFEFKEVPDEAAVLTSRRCCSEEANSVSP